MSGIKVGICGASGKMGRILVRAVSSDKDFILVAALEALDNKNVGNDAGEVAGKESLGINITDNKNEFFSNLDVIIDFSSPIAVIDNIKRAVESNTCYILGTTGLKEDVIKLIKESSKKIGIIMSANMSLGVNIAFHLSREIAGLLDEEYDVEINEIHHKDKIDAPSGTALALGHAVASGRKVDFNKKSIYNRHGEVGKREKGTIGFSVQRGGDVVGDHKVSFIGQSERIEITHKATSRMIFANGALRGAKWLVNQPPGLYEMKDVLGL